MKKSYQQLNSEAWNQEARNLNGWTVPVPEEALNEAKKGKLSITLSPFAPMPEHWVSEFGTKSVLCLGSGGGQQAPLLAAYGCSVTALDISKVQLERDKETAGKAGCPLTVCQGDMQDLSRFESGSFDIVFNPTSTCFIADVVKMYREVSRVLKPGGVFFTSATNPALYLFDEKKMLKGKAKIRYTIPYSDLQARTARQLKKMEEEHDTFEFSHTVNDLLGGITRNGMIIEDIFTDSSGNDTADSYLHDCYFAVKARKL